MEERSTDTSMDRSMERESLRQRIELSLRHRVPGEQGYWYRAMLDCGLTENEIQLFGGYEDLMRLNHSVSLNAPHLLEHTREAKELLMRLVLDRLFEPEESSGAHPMGTDDRHGESDGE